MSYDNRCICGAPYAEAKHRQPCPLYLPEVDPQLRRPINGKRLREEVERLLGQGDIDCRKGGTGFEYHEGWENGLHEVLDLLDQAEGVKP